MPRLIFLCTCIFFLASSGYAQSHGLDFSSHEVVPEKRTSLNLTTAESFCLHDKADISFDMKFRPNLEIYFGYIVRIITSNHENIDIVYNQKLRNLNFVIGENFSAVFSIDSVKLFSEWNHFRIRFDEKTREVSFYLNEKLIGKGKANFSGQICCKIYFGTNDFEGFQTADIPPMSLKDIRVTEDGRDRYYFTLSESQGNTARDLVGDKNAIVKNPVWIKPKHQNWQQIQSFVISSTPSVAFKQSNEVLYIVSKDSLYEISIKNSRLKGIKLVKGRDTLPPGNQSIYDNRADKLYNFYIDEQKVSVYDPGKLKWDVNFSPSPLTIFWHANKFLSHLDTSLYIVGGYGQLQYKNLVQRFHFPCRKWEIIKPGGDPFMPRYMAALGTNRVGDTALILGGYGSNTGEQTINPKYNYDLFAYSVKNNSFKRIYHLKEPARQFCFANSLIIDPATNDFYTLTYPTDRFNSSLQLIKGSLRSPEYQLMGDSIPYFFYDVKSFADLYYSPDSKKLIAVTLYSSGQNVTEVKVYTIDFPPNKLDSFPVEQKKSIQGWLYFLGAAFLVTLWMAVFFLSKKKSRPEFVPAKNVAASRNEVAGVMQTVEQEQATSSFAEGPRSTSVIFLFGQFEVFDRNCINITQQCTPLIRELLLLIIIYSFRDGKGISLEKLFEILWSDKSPKDARNNYSVNIVKLKHILEKVGECQIIKESGKWKFEVLNDSIKIDYQKYISLTSGRPVISKAYINELMGITGRGPFLPGLHYNWLDDIKADVSSQVIELILKYISSTDIASEPEFTVKAANCIFFFDHLNEEALLYKCRCLILLGRHGMAKEAYLKFSKEYSENYGQNFERSFTEITGH